jgi:YHS domain-containing protein/thiol-disulfide isomerase/thioredoxin
VTPKLAHRAVEIAAGTEESANFAQSHVSDYPIPIFERSSSVATAHVYRLFARGILMPRHLRPVSGMLASLLLTLSASAQEAGVHWQQDIETAKSMARDSGRLVLVHVVADGCGPCHALESNVFAQPGVGAAIEQKFVPVKLNANEFPAIAQGFGITRVPTDVILTPDGQILSKAISPATPSAYIAETSNVSNQYASQLGRPYQTATASLPSPPLLNQAYADLPIGALTAPSTARAAPVTVSQAAAPTAPATVNNSFATTGSAANASVPSGGYVTATAPNYAPSQPPVTPLPTNPAADPYAAYAPPAQPAAPALAPVEAPRYGYEPSPSPTPAAPPNYSAPPDRSVPPTNPGGPVSEEAQRPAGTQQASTAPDPSKLPPGAPPLGFDGYCPVSMRTSWKWLPGNPAYGAIHRGRTYWFAGAEEQKQFLANPDYYAPALAGVDPVLAIDHHQSVPGLRDHSLDYDGQFFLFSSEATLQQFTSSPERYASGVRQAMGLAPSEQTR